MISRYLYSVCLGIILVAFFAVRLLPIIHQAVPFTYDQGRDFLKAYEIIAQHHLTFIGPTTGINGLFHGVWWYYMLGVFYFIFQGWPLGFYISLTMLFTVCAFAFSYFVFKRLGLLEAILFLSIVSISGYFTFISFFPANNSVTPLFVLLFIFSVYEFLRTKNNYFLWLVFLSIGFIFETEVPFGLFLIPTFLLCIGIFPTLRSAIKNPRNILYSSVFLIIAFIPRILFEIKNHFLQTKIFINFFLHPTTYQASQSLSSVFFDRNVLFHNYVLDIFWGRNILLSLLFLGSAMYGYFLLIRSNKKNISNKEIYTIFPFILVCLYIFSLLYKNNFFWANYFEGIQFIILFCFIQTIHIIHRSKMGSHFLSALVSLLVILNMITLFQTLSTKDINTNGLRAAELTIQTIQKEVGQQDFCLKIYTPPVIPFTYNYLLNYYTKNHTMRWPFDKPINNGCWYIVEKEQNGVGFQARITVWRHENIPATAKKEKEYTLPNGTLVEYWHESK